MCFIKITSSHCSKLPWKQKDLQSKLKCICSCEGKHCPENSVFLQFRQSLQKHIFTGVPSPQFQQAWSPDRLSDDHMALQAQLSLHLDTQPAGEAAGIVQQEQEITRLELGCVE